MSSNRVRDKRTDFTHDDDVLLMKYIATYNPQKAGRAGQNLYKNLMDKKWDWVERHTWQSWRERYKNHQKWFDSHAAKWQKKKGIDPDRSPPPTSRVAKYQAQARASTQPGADESGSGLEDDDEVEQQKVVERVAEERKPPGKQKAPAPKVVERAPQKAKAAVKLTALGSARGSSSRQGRSAPLSTPSHSARTDLVDALKEEDEESQDVGGDRIAASETEQDPHLDLPTLYDHATQERSSSAPRTLDGSGQIDQRVKSEDQMQVPASQTPEPSPLAEDDQMEDDQVEDDQVEDVQVEDDQVEDDPVADDQDLPGSDDYYGEIFDEDENVVEEADSGAADNGDVTSDHDAPSEEDDRTAADGEAEADNPDDDDRVAGSQSPISRHRALLSSSFVQLHEGSVTPTRPLYPDISSLPVAKRREADLPPEPSFPGSFLETSTPLDAAGLKSSTQNRSQSRTPLFFPSSSSPPATEAPLAETLPPVLDRKRKGRVRQEPTPPTSAAEPDPDNHVEVDHPPQVPVRKRRAGAPSSQTAAPSISDAADPAASHLHSVNTGARNRPVPASEGQWAPGSTSMIASSRQDAHKRKRSESEVDSDESDAFTTIAEPTPVRELGSMPPPPSARGSGVRRKVFREPPRIEEGPYIIAFTDGSGRGRLSRNGSRTVGVEKDDLDGQDDRLRSAGDRRREGEREDDTWPPRRNKKAAQMEKAREDETRADSAPPSPEWSVHPYSQAATQDPAPPITRLTTATSKPWKTLVNDSAEPSTSRSAWQFTANGLLNEPPSLESRAEGSGAGAPVSRAQKRKMLMATLSPLSRQPSVTDLQAPSQAPPKDDARPSAIPPMQSTSSSAENGGPAGDEDVLMSEEGEAPDSTDADFEEHPYSQVVPSPVVTRPRRSEARRRLFPRKEPVYGDNLGHASASTSRQRADTDELHVDPIKVIASVSAQQTGPFRPPREPFQAPSRPPSFASTERFPSFAPKSPTPPDQASSSGIGGSGRSGYFDVFAANNQAPRVNLVSSGDRPRPAKRARMSLPGGSDGPAPHSLVSKLRGAPRVRYSLPNPRVSGLRSSHSDTSISSSSSRGPRFSGVALSLADLPEPDQHLVADLGLAAAIEELSNNHGFREHVVLNLFDQTHSLQRTDEILRGMRESAGAHAERVMARLLPVEAPGSRSASAEDGGDGKAVRAILAEDDGHSTSPAERAESASARRRSSRRRSRVSVDFSRIIKPATPDEEEAAGYSPPVGTRSRAYMRLSRQGRVGEAVEREAQIASRGGTLSPRRSRPEFEMGEGEGEVEVDGELPGVADGDGDVSMEDSAASALAPELGSDAVTADGAVDQGAVHEEEEEEEEVQPTIVKKGLRRLFGFA